MLGINTEGVYLANQYKINKKSIFINDWADQKFMQHEFKVSIHSFEFSNTKIKNKEIMPISEKMLISTIHFRLTENHSNREQILK